MSNMLTIRLNADGSISIDATKMNGSAEQIMDELNVLTETVGGELIVEEHIHGAHTHTHDHGHVHN